MYSPFIYRHKIAVEMSIAREIFVFRLYSILSRFILQVSALELTFIHFDAFKNQQPRNKTLSRKRISKVMQNKIRVEVWHFLKIC